jgi:hypothetical protein
MMKKNTLIVVLIFLYFISGSSVFAQKIERIKVVGEIVGYDKLSPLFHITFAEKLQTFILKVDKVLKGKESENYIIVVHKTFDNENKLLEKILKGSNKVKLKLRREKSCDSSLERLKIEWVSKLTTKPDSKMPCYLLNAKDIIFMK